MVWVSWGPSKCETVFSWCWDSHGFIPVAQPWRIFGKAPGGNLCILHCQGKGDWPAVCQGSLQVTPKLAPADSPVPLHPYAHAFSGSFGTALGNSCTGHPPGPAGGMESGSVTCSLTASVCSGLLQSIQYQCLLSFLRVVLRHCVHTFLRGPMFTELLQGISALVPTRTHSWPGSGGHRYSLLYSGELPVTQAYSFMYLLVIQGTFWLC